jgi:hypothetical protein
MIMPTKSEIQEFSEMIEVMAREKKMPLMDTIIMHCEQTGLEIEVSATLISPALKSVIREEAQNLNMIKKNSKLPV